MQQHGWTLLFHDNLIEQMMKLRAAVLRAQENDPEGFGSNANVKFFRALVQLIQDVVPSDPARDEYRQGNTMGPAYRHWRRPSSEDGMAVLPLRLEGEGHRPYAWSTMNRPCGLRETNRPVCRVREDARARESAGRMERIGTGKASRIGANWNSVSLSSR